MRLLAIECYGGLSYKWILKRIRQIHFGYETRPFRYNLQLKKSRNLQLQEVRTGTRKITQQKAEWKNQNCGNWPKHLLLRRSQISAI